jgi:lipoprotein-releasing system ATP-binding protein
MLKANAISKSYGDLQVLKNVDIHIKKGEIVSIVGKSGTGKSTLLHILGSLDTPDTGEVFIDGQSLNKMNDKDLAAFRNEKIGFVFQFHHLLAEFNALENVCIPAYIKGSDKKAAESKAKELLSYLGLSNRTDHKPSQLSGGEQQRVAVARSLINSPSIVFADEPTGNLDNETSEELHKLFLSLKQDFDQTFVIVTHNEDLAGMSDRRLEMVDGRFV